MKDAAKFKVSIKTSWMRFATSEIKSSSHFSNMTHSRYNIFLQILLRLEAKLDISLLHPFLSVFNLIQPVRVVQCLFI